jgi:hypothetical protein
MFAVLSKSAVNQKFSLVFVALVSNRTALVGTPSSVRYEAIASASEEATLPSLDSSAG